jgi:uncharacterized protein
VSNRLGSVALPLVLGLLLVGVPAVFQDRQIYFPDNPSLAVVLADARRHGLAPWPAEDEYRGLLREAEGPARATLLLFHGNAGHAGHRGWYAQMLNRQGVRVVLAEYPGYGPRAGKLGEASFVADAAETLALVRRHFPGPFILAGESLGAAVAAAVAKNADADALLLITPWDNLKSIAGHHYPWLPVGWLLRDRYDSVDNLAGYRGRVAVVVAEEDSIVPAKFGRALFATLSEPKRLWTIPAADHNDWPMRVDYDWWAEVMVFLLP